MAFESTTKLANRFGLDLKFYEYDKSADDYKGDLAASIDFANSCTFEISGEPVFATGGQDARRLIKFDNPLEGTFTISTQVSTIELLALVSGEDPTTVTKTITFKNDPAASTKSYVLEAETIYKDDADNIYTEKITLCKIQANKNYSVEYNGDGDPQSIEVTFTLFANEDGEVAIIERDDAPAS
jgi:hypothetical protein